MAACNLQENEYKEAFRLKSQNHGEREYEELKNPSRMYKSRGTGMNPYWKQEVEKIGEKKKDARIVWTECFE